MSVNCEFKVVTIPSVVDFEYRVGESQAEYEVGTFENDEEVYCPLTYTILYDTTRAWLVQDGERKMKWSTD